MSRILAEGLSARDGPRPFETYTGLREVVGLNAGSSDKPPS